MKNMKSKTAQLIALSLAVLITMVSNVIPQTAMAQKIEPQAQSAPGEMEGFEAATSRTTVDETQLKEKQAREQQSTAASSPETSQMSAPANDNFANAQVLSGTSGTAAGTNAEATLESGEPFTNLTNKTVWYKWTAPSNLSMTFETTGGGTLSDTALAVYTGAAINALTLIASNDDINDGAQNTLSRVTFIANSGTAYYIQVRGYVSDQGTFNLVRQINHAETSKQFNFDGASGSITTDYAVFRPSNNNWYIRLSDSNGALLAQQWGTSGDKLYPGDFDGDNSTDIAVFRRFTGVFYVLRSKDNTLQSVQWGQSGDIPVAGDFDGDDISDFAVWRPANATFYVRQSTNGTLLAKQWGLNGDGLACADYDGDGKTDFGVRRTDNGDNAIFYILRSSDDQVVSQSFGLSTDQLAQGDFDNDGKADIACYRNGTPGRFYALNSSNGAVYGTAWGSSGDIFVTGDYTGDNRSDVTVFRPSTGTFYSLNTVTNSLSATQWGTSGDYPVTTSLVY